MEGSDRLFPETLCGMVIVLAALFVSKFLGFHPGFVAAAAFVAVIYLLLSAEERPWVDFFFNSLLFPTALMGWLTFFSLLVQASKEENGSRVLALLLLGIVVMVVTIVISILAKELFVERWWSFSPVLKFGHLLAFGGVIIAISVTFEYDPADSQQLGWVLLSDTGFSALITGLMFLSRLKYSRQRK